MLQQAAGPGGSLNTGCDQAPTSLCIPSSVVCRAASPLPLPSRAATGNAKAASCVDHQPKCHSRCTGRRILSWGQRSPGAVYYDYVSLAFSPWREGSLCHRSAAQINQPREGGVEGRQRESGRAKGTRREWGWQRGRARPGKERGMPGCVSSACHTDLPVNWICWQVA